MKLECITPTIQVTDLIQGIEFYEQLGFEKDWLWPENNPTHASVSMNGVNFMMVKARDNHIQKADLYFTMEDVRSFHHHLKKRLTVSDLIQSDYGMLDFSIEDPWGHHLTFGTAEGTFTN